MQRGKQYKKNLKQKNQMNYSDSEDNAEHQESNNDQNVQGLENHLDNMSDRSGSALSKTDKHDQSKMQVQPEQELLDEVLLSQKKTYKDRISEQLENKLKELKSTVKGKDVEEVLNIRMHELAISKILVFTHGKSSLILVIAHAHMGEAYINFQCYQQAIDHLTIALKKNKKLFDIKSKQFDTKTYHAQILTSLGKCYYETGCYVEALEELNKARQHQTSSSNDNELMSTKTLLLIANCHSKLQDYQKSLDTIDEVVQIFSIRLGESAFQTVMALNQKSKVYAIQSNYNLAFETLEKVIKTFTKMQYSKPELLADLYRTLASYQEKLGKIEGQQASLQKIKSIYVSIFPPTDKRVIKIKKQIAMFFFKIDNHKDALLELNETLDLQEKVYGEVSHQVVVTLKLIGQIYKRVGDQTEAKVYIQRAQKIEQSLKIADSNKNKLKFTAGIKEKKALQKPFVNKEKKEPYS